MTTKLKNALVAQSISKLYLNNEFADFTFTFGNEKVPVHKAILASASPVFCAMFFGYNKNKVCVEVTDSHVGAFKEFLQLFYLGEVKLTMENIDEVAKLADKYDMLDCINTCTAFLGDQLTHDNLIWGYKLAISLKNENLKQFCEQIIGLHTDKIFKSDAFLRCDRGILKTILQIDRLLCTETEIFEACLSWAKYACQLRGFERKNAQNLRTQLGDCLYMIRFTSMTTENFATQTEPFKGLLTSDEAAEIFYAISVPNAKAIRFIQKPRSIPFIDARTWDNTNTLLCEYEREELYVEREVDESWVLFCVNIRALLGELQTTPVYDDYENDDRYPFVVTIGEIEDKLVHKHSRTFRNVLFKEEVRLGINSKKIPLTQLLLIQPNTLYAIHFEQVKNLDSDSVYINYMERLKTQYKSDDKLIVTFPPIDDANLVSSIRFCPI